MKSSGSMPCLSVQNTGVKALPADSSMPVCHRHWHRHKTISMPIRMSRHCINPWGGLKSILNVSQITRSWAFHSSPGYPNKKRRGKQPGSAGELVQPPVFICPKTTAPSWVSCTSAARTLPPQKLATSIKAPANPYLIHDFIVLLPSLWPLATPVVRGPFISEQKIGGICEGKMRLCEAKVKS